MQLASMAPSCASSLSKQVFQRKQVKILGEYEPIGKCRREEVKLLKLLAPPFMVAAIALSPISNPPVSLGQTIDVQKGATLFRRACIGCHDAGGNIIQPGATLFLNDLQRNGVDTEEEIYRVTYYGKGRMPGFGENCTPRGQCTFGPRLREDEIKLLAEFVKSQAEQGWPKIETEGYIQCNPPSVASTGPATEELLVWMSYCCTFMLKCDLCFCGRTNTSVDFSE